MAKSLYRSEKQNRRIYISELDQHLFAQGTHYEIYKKLGAHLSWENGEKGTFFAVWAPHAQGVNVIGSFNDWNETAHPMRRLGDSGIYQLFVPGAEAGAAYQFLVYAGDGRKLYKADPFANASQLRPQKASVVTDISEFTWNDSTWMRERKEKDMNREPFAIYECHIGSWMKKQGNIFFSYREFADRIVDYLKQLKFTHVELLGIAEHPLDASWGYQVTGYYAPTSRYGTPEDFAYLVDTLHRNKIGVILDWVPAHFPKDAHGLAEFDGEVLFEHPDPAQGEHPVWGTKAFHYGRQEVSNFLIANALYWIREFHVDGLRVDAVASMLYLDFDKGSGEWIPDTWENNRNPDAIAFLEQLNFAVQSLCPDVMMIAEESTAWPHVTGSLKEGGLGFHFKWNMGWMHDFCEYMRKDHRGRKESHNLMNFAMSYHDAENYILPLSHDEVVHRKGSMSGKMPGNRQDRFSNLRLGYTYMFGHSGKKLLFMGQEFGQEREWSEERELDWLMLKNELNQGMQEYVKELLEIYHRYPCMYRIDNGWAGFEWMNADDCDRCTYSFIRKSPDSKERLLFVLNMSPHTYPDFCVGVPEKKKYKLLLNSCDKKFGGYGQVVLPELTAQAKPCDHQPCSITFELPSYAALVFSF